MPGEAASNNEDDLLSQIDELKARMDRLMKGGTSTSNSALLTDQPRPASPAATEALSEPKVSKPRSRVGDLIAQPDTETVEVSKDEREVVVFPEEPPMVDNGRTVDRPTSPPPPTKPRPPAVGGSVISVDEKRGEGRPKAASFDEIGSVIERELARDESVPPASPRKGPDLASRFGPADEPVDPAESEPARDQVVDEVDEAEEVADTWDDEAEDFDHRRSPIGALIAIWVFTAIASGAIATLHFTGII